MCSFHYLIISLIILNEFDFFNQFNHFDNSTINLIRMNWNKLD